MKTISTNITNINNFQFKLVNCLYKNVLKKIKLSFPFEHRASQFNEFHELV
jgi:hypothetical protein